MDTLLEGDKSPDGTPVSVKEQEISQAVKAWMKAEAEAPNLGKPLNMGAINKQDKAV